MTKNLIILGAVVLLMPVVGAAQKPTPKPKIKPTPTPQQVQRATLAGLIRLEKAQRSALLAQQRARASQQAHAAQVRRQAQARINPPLRIVARPPAATPRPVSPKPTPTPTPAPARSTKFTGVITAVDMEKLTVTVTHEGTERTFAFTPTVSLNFYSGEGNGLKGLTKGTTIDITSADGKNADVIVVHDLP